MTFKNINCINIKNYHYDDAKQNSHQVLNKIKFKLFCAALQGWFNWDHDFSKFI